MSRVCSEKLHSASLKYPLSEHKKYEGRKAGLCEKEKDRNYLLATFTPNDEQDQQRVRRKYMNQAKISSSHYLFVDDYRIKVWDISWPILENRLSVSYVDAEVHKENMSTRRMYYSNSSKRTNVYQVYYRNNKNARKKYTHLGTMDTVDVIAYYC